LLLLFRAACWSHQIVYQPFSYSSIRSSATGVCGLKLLVHAGLSY
jgi:hypothetical protein